MGTIADFGKAAENIEGRIMSGFIKGPDGQGGSEYHTLGHAQSVSVSFDPVTQEADNRGREKVLGFDVTAEIVMQQTSATEFAAVADIAETEGAGDEVRFVDRGDDPTGSKGFTFTNVFPSVSGQIDGNGEGSNFTVTISGRLLASNFGREFVFGAS